MCIRKSRRGITIAEVLVLILVIGGLLALLLPAIEARRISPRRSQCLNNLKQIGLAFHNYLDAKGGQLPANGAVVGGSDGVRGTVVGWSFLVRLLPYMEYKPIYNSLPVDTGDPVTNATSAAVQTASDTLLPELSCPADPNRHFADPDGKQGRKYALTNYKGIGATCMPSLTMALMPGAAVVARGAPGDDPAKHPDGAIVPGKPLSLKDFTDGTAHTLLCAETIDNVRNTGAATGSRWLCASDAMLVGLPVGAQPPGVTGAVSLEKTSKGFWAPTGCENDSQQLMYSADNANKTYRAFRTFLAFDFAGADKGSYPALPLAVPNKPAFGPSSGHPGSVNHLFADGSTCSVSKEVDAAVYMFLITRAGGDPFVPPPS